MDSETQDSFLADSELRKRVTDVVKVATRDLGLPDTGYDDVTQIVLMKLFSLSRDDLRPIENLNSYLFKAARNEGLRLQQKTKTDEQIGSDEEGNIIFSDEAEEANRIESEVLLREIWESLQGVERELFRLMLIGYREKEMATRLGVSYDVVRKRVERLRGKLRELLLE